VDNLLSKSKKSCVVKFQKKWVFQKFQIYRNNNKILCIAKFSLFIKVIEDTLITCSFFSSRKTCRKQDVKHTLRKRCRVSAVLQCLFFSFLTNATSCARPQKRARYISICVFRQFDAVHQAVEIPNFVVNSALRNASTAWKKNQTTSASVVGRFKSSFEASEKEKNNAEEKGKR